MTDDAGGNYSLPNGYLAVSGQKVLPSNHNPPLEDLAQSMTARLMRDGRGPMLGPLAMGGFKATGLGAGTDAADAVTKSQLDAVSTAVSAKYSVKTANYTALDADVGTTFRFTTAATLTFDVTANLRTNWTVEVWNDSTGTVIIDPDGTDTINGGPVLVLQPGQRAEVFKTAATTFQASVVGNAQLTPDFVRGLTIVNNTGNPNTHIDITAGSAKLGLLVVSNGSTMTKRLNGTWAVGSGNGGLDTGSTTPGATYHIFSLRRQSDGAFDAVFSLSVAGPNMALLSGYDVIQRINSVILDGAGNIRATVQRGNWMILKSPIDDYTGGNRAMALLAITVPNGIRVRSKHSVYISLRTGSDTVVNALLADGDDNAAITARLTVVGSGIPASAFWAEGSTNTARQINASFVLTSGAQSGSHIIATLGWEDYTIPRIA